MVNKINSNNFNNEIQNGVSIIDFFAEWCGPCKMLGPVFEELSNEMNDTVRFYKLDVDESLDKAYEYKVSTVPTMIIFKEGKVAEKLIGFMTKEQIKEKVEKYL